VLLAAVGARALLACGGLDADHDQPLWLLLLVVDGEVGNVVVPCMAAVPGMVALRRSAVAVDRMVAAPCRAVAARPVAAPCRVVAAPCMSVVVAPYRMAVGSVPGKVVVVVVAEVGRTVDHRPDVATGKSQLNPSH
jgi:hypothetical protein